MFFQFASMGSIIGFVFGVLLFWKWNDEWFWIPYLTVVGALSSTFALWIAAP